MKVVVAAPESATPEPAQLRRRGSAAALRNPRPEAVLIQAGAAIAQQGPRAVAQRRQADALQHAAARHARLPLPSALAPLAAAVPTTGPLPRPIRAGVERQSGLSLDAVTVHYNSPRPAALQALAYAQSREIYLAPGAEAHLPHEAWHVVQQAQGRVPGRAVVSGVALNDDAALEREADEMGARAIASGPSAGAARPAHAPAPGVVQRRLPPVETIEGDIRFGRNPANTGLMLYRLLHMEVSQGRLLRAADGQAYADADTALADVFANDRFNTAAYARLYAANQQYREVLPPSQAITDDSWRLLQRGLTRASFLAFQCALRPDDIEAVFGQGAPLDTVAATYRRVSARLAGFGRDNFTIDYHGDDSEMGIGGFTVPGSGRIQVSPGVLAKDANTLAVMLMHEGCHEVDRSIRDLGYYGSARFDKMSARQKLENAAHYEEVARRVNGNSAYPTGQAFVPEAEQRVQPGPRAELIRMVRPASEGLRNLWDRASDLHLLLRQIASGTSTLAGDMQLNAVRLIKGAFSLPLASVDGRPLVTELDLALTEASAKVFSRAKTELGRFRNEQSPPERVRLGRMSVKQLALEAIRRVGGFQGIDPAINETAVNQLRVAVISVLDLPDPFPQMAD